MYTYKVTIIRVVDGDTVDVDIDLGFGMIYSNQRIRLQGIDTPECRTRDPIEKQFGFIAKRFLESKIPMGSKCTMRSHEYQKGKFGRILGEFIIQDGLGMSVSINDLMIGEHLAVEYYGQSKDDIEDEHLRNRKIVLSEGKHFIHSI